MKPAGVWTLIMGVCVTGIGCLTGLAGLGEAGRYATLVSQGNPFAGMASNSAMYLLAPGAMGVLAGIGLMIVGASMKRDPAAMIGRRHGGYVWDGTTWISEADWAARKP